MRKLALALSALALGGCMFLTPPTGLRVGDHSQEFAHLQQQPTVVDAATLEYLTYAGQDFSALYPKSWGEGTASTDFTGASTTRFSAGVRTPAGESEGIVVTTINRFTGQAPSNAALAIFVKGSLQAGTTAFEVVSETAEDTLGGEKANRIEVKTKDAQGHENHMVAYSLMHEARGWVVVISTLEGRWTSLVPVFERMKAEFKWKPGVAPTTAPSADPLPGQVPASPGAGTGSQAPTSPTPTPSGAPHVAPPSPVAGATQPPSPSPTP